VVSTGVAGRTGHRRELQQAMKINHRAVTDVGRRRKGNEDSLFVNLEHRLFVVADGMGGHAAGEVASRVAVEAINEFICLTGGDREITWPFELDENASFDGNRLKTAIRFANQKVLDATQQSAEYEGMATTVVAALVEDGVVNVAHVGDSRVYLLRDGALRQLTNDHSWVNEQIQNGVISPDQARTHPLRNVVTRALGGRTDLQVDLQALPVRADDVLMLCTDGLTTMLGDAEIFDCMTRALPDVDRAAEQLVAEANERGGEDNITVVLVQFLP
jgi:serine/threonine protein phosphatase PrpC